jgi:hypothetical protein
MTLVIAHVEIRVKGDLNCRVRRRRMGLLAHWFGGELRHQAGFLKRKESKRRDRSVRGASEIIQINIEQR